MSRSRRPKCPNGRGCSCCGHASVGRRQRESAWARADEQNSPREAILKETGHPRGFDVYYVGSRHSWMTRAQRR